MYGVWSKELHGEMNVTLAFTLSFDEAKSFTMDLAAADCYKIYLDGEFFAFGPQRAAHGYARVAQYTATAKRLVVEIHSHCVNTYCWIKQPPFFACKVQTAECGRAYGYALGA